MATSTIKRTTAKLVLLSVAMFGFGYALVPLYDVFCKVTGINGKTGRISYENAKSLEADSSRIVTVAFDTNIREIPWDFRALDHKVSVHPGQLGEATFVVTNNSGQAITGRAIPSIAPTQASIYFKKTECFCFSEQSLAAGETRKMKVRFVVDTELPERFSALTLSYTYFPIPKTDKIAQKQNNVDYDRI